ncbi:hypothetical protein ACEQ8H_008914 [Pleosporales sp. CAS-2024a]
MDIEKCVPRPAYKAINQYAWSTYFLWHPRDRAGQDEGIALASIQSESRAWSDSSCSLCATEDVEHGYVGGGLRGAPLIFNMRFEDGTYTKRLEYSTFADWNHVEALLQEIEGEGAAPRQLWDVHEDMPICRGDWAARVHPGMEVDVSWRKTDDWDCSSSLSSDDAKDAHEGARRRGHVPLHQERWWFGAWKRRVEQETGQGRRESTISTAMASRIASTRAMLPDLEAALQSFTSSPSKFGVVRTVNASSTQARTLYILDSSFNPPSMAHLTLATRALKQHAPSAAAPHRLLLLLSTHNADKAPGPASFAQRLALMTLFAEDVSHRLQRQQAPLPGGTQGVPIDIGLTKEPYYSDKSTAIQAAAPPCYAPDAVHVHLVGYDTLVRVCNPKYYPHHQPPLSALGPFFAAGHQLRVTPRPADASDASSSALGTVEEQAQYLQRLRDGAEQEAGFVPAWADSIDLAPAEAAAGISSTRVRSAAKEAQWGVVEALCTEGVAAWLQDQALYREDAAGSKRMG